MGTASAAGMVVIGLASPALAAACLDNAVGSPEVIICAGPDSTAESFTATKDYSVSLGSLSPFDTPYTWTGGPAGTAVTVDAAGHQGAIALTPDSSIQNNTGNGLVLKNLVGTTVDINNLVEGGHAAAYGAPNVYEPGDGLRVLSPSGEVTINVHEGEGNTGALVGADDGLVVLGTGGTSTTSGAGIHINNTGEIVGRGLSSASQNDSEGIHISQGGTFGSNIDATVSIDNQGFVFGAPSALGGNSNYGGGQGISVSANGHINIVNQVNGAPGVATLDNETSLDGVAAIIGRDGIKAQGEDGIHIDNSAQWDGWSFHSGGLIYGTSNDGVNIANMTGGVQIDNAGTWGDTTSLSGLTGISEDSSLGLGPSFSDLVFPSRGIIGAVDGVNIGDVTGGNVIVNNSFLNSNGTALDQGGFIDGLSGNGVTMDLGSFSGHLATLDNRTGLTLGEQNGVSILQQGGGTLVANANGVIEGFAADGVRIGDSEDMSNVATVANGNFGKMQYLPYSEDYNPTDGGGGGIITGVTSAVDIHANEALVYNGTGGVILGAGSYDDPVIKLHTASEFDSSSEDGAPLVGTGGFVWNKGLIAGNNIPYYSGMLGPDNTVLGADSVFASSVIPGIFDNSAGLLWDVNSDVSNISTFVWNAGQSGSLANLSSYSDAASDVIIRSNSEDTGSTSFFNDTGSVAIGRVVLTGSTEDTSEGGTTTHNSVINAGTWLVKDVYDSNSEDYYGVILGGSVDDTVENGNLIQGAFDNSEDGQERLDFTGVGTFYNGQYTPPLLPDPLQSGLISVIDGGAGDVLTTDHNFVGAPGYSFVGLDANLGANADEDVTVADVQGGDPASWYADRFAFGSSSEDVTSGSTGLIINNIGSGANHVGETVLVGSASTVDASCDGACADGDPFYVASASDGYVNFNGTGAIQDGMFAWYLTQHDSEDGPTNFALQTYWAPQGQQLGALVTGGQNLWYDTSAGAEEHINDQLQSGGKGADVAVGQTLPGPSNGIVAWAKATGSQFSRTTSVTQTVPPAGPITIDTSLVQGTFGLLAGADIDPGDSSGIRAGTFGGVLGSNLAFTSYGATASYLGGTAGVYVTYVPDPASGLFAYGEGKADLVRVTYTAPFAFNGAGTLTNIGVKGDVGYKVDLGGSAYVAPVGSLAIVDTMLSGFTAGGGTATFSNGLSIRPGVGVIVGTTVPVKDGMTADLSASFKIWDELGAPNTVTLSDGVNSTTFGDGISGLFAELRANAQLDTGVDGLSILGSAGLKTNGAFTDFDGKLKVSKSF